MPQSLTIRATTSDDLAAIDRLLAGAYPTLLKHDYPPSAMVTAIPVISRAQPDLLACGTYFGVFDEEERPLAAGGWTLGTPGTGAAYSGVGHIRHVVTDHRHTRQGIGRRLMSHIVDSATAADVGLLKCQSTLTAVPFYEANGFKALGYIDVPLRPGINFPAVAMERRISD